MKGKHLDYLNPELVASVKELSKTHTVKEAMFQLGLSEHKIKKISKIHGIRFDQKQKLSKKDIPEVSKLVTEKPVVDIAAQYGVSYRYLYEFMRKYKIHVERTEPNGLGTRTLPKRVDHKDESLIAKVKTVAGQMTMLEAAAKLGLTQTQLRDVAHENGIVFTGYKVFQQGDEFLIKELISEGISVQEIAVKWDCMPQNVYGFIKKHGIKTKRQEMKQ